MFDCYDTLITPEEVADMLGCGMNTTYKLLKSGKIKAMRIGRSWKIPKRAVQEYRLYLDASLKPKRRGNCDVGIFPYGKRCTVHGKPDGNIRGEPVC